MKAMLKRFMKDERGIELAEWAVMAALIIAAAVGVVSLLGQAIATRFGEVQTAIEEEVN
ncbi:Flp family type IVb pilin [Anaerobaca lacustris]|uniref:Flp family type IVb pilin n=1 Tax=Anaerobaca lacustris TaxID=3044600 RepID=A0AAW6U1D3_9BACT|nr:Flp family type IVb pilin [Sedimentisphaerales bacterium M17dextr]